MNNSPRNLLKLNLSIALCFFFLFLAPTHAQKNPTPDLKPNPNPKTKPESNSKIPSKPKPNPKPGPNPKISSKTKPPTTSTYHFANHFCLSRRLDVRSTFCLKVLRSGPASTTAEDNQALLNIAADLAIQFGNKTLILLNKLWKDERTAPNLKPAIEECLSAYEGYLEQYKMLLEEAKTETQLASYDAELAKIEIKRCVKALSETKNADIEAKNKIALDFTKLSQNIADSIDASEK